MAAQSIQADLWTGYVHDHEREETVSVSEGQAALLGLTQCPDCFGGGA